MKKGFTLVELLVTVGLFVIIITIAVGGFTNAIRTERQVSSLISAQSNVSLALEQMSREIRTGYLFCHAGTPPVTDWGVGTPQGSAAANALPDCGCTISRSPAPTGSWTCNALDFYDAATNHVVYETTSTGPLAGTLIESSTQLLNPLSVTGGGITVKYLKFYLYGEVEGDNTPPRITIVIGITPSSSDPAVANDVINLQTTVSSRNIDCAPGTPASC